MGSTDRFTSRADAYALARPSYPHEAVAAIVAGLGDSGDLAVADLGAGTGISSRLIADVVAGVRVFAIEPNRAMREAAAPDARVTWVDATAEETTLEAHSVDAVTAFQAWHWVDQARALAEARRVLRPGGVLAVVYNERDERDAFTAAFGDIVRRYALDETEARRASALDASLAIAPLRTARLEYRNAQALDRAGLHARAASSSYLPQSGASADAMHAEIDALVSRAAPSDAVSLHLVTTLARVEV